MTTLVSRRIFLGGSIVAAAGAARLCAADAPAGPGPGRSFTFAHLTDIHVQPELGAVEGFQQCIAKVNALNARPDFAITGGDLIMDALAVDRDRLNLQLRLFDECCRRFELPVHHTIGNHDVVGWKSDAKLTKADPEFGKKIFAERYGQGRTYRSFDHGGWHFVLLDSIGQDKDKPDYIGLVDEAQQEWLADDLAKTGRTTPVILVTHIPFYSTWHQVISGPTKPVSASSLVSNSHEFRKLLAPYNVRLVLSGHGHIRERIEVGHVTHIQSGAVSGLWWKGPVHGDEEAFGLVTCHPDGAFDYRYQTYGWQARKASNGG